MDDMNACREVDGDLATFASSADQRAESRAKVVAELS